MGNEIAASPLRAFLDKDRLSPLYQAVGEILAGALERAERHGRDPQRPIASIFATADAICEAIRDTLRSALDARPLTAKAARPVASANDELMAAVLDMSEEEFEALKTEVTRLNTTYGSRVTCPDCGIDYHIAISGRKTADIPTRVLCFRCWQKQRAASPSQEIHMDQSPTESRTLNCYFIDDDGAEAFVAAQHAGEALHVYVSLQGGDCDSDAFTVTLVPDDEVPNLKLQQSESAEQPEGCTLREALEAARRGGRAEILSTSEF